MKRVIHPLMSAVLAGCLMSACSNGDQAQRGVAVSPVEAVSPAKIESPIEDASTPTDDPCHLLTDVEVGVALSATAKSQRNRSLEGNGIQTCVWDTPTDRFVVQVFDAGSGTVEDELRSRVSGSVDRLKSGAAGVRYETVAGVGDQAMSVVEKADPQRGILADTAVLVMQRGDRRAVLFTGSALAGGDRATALAALETLGRSAAKRL